MTGKCRRCGLLLLNGTLCSWCSFNPPATDRHEPTDADKHAEWFARREWETEPDG